MTTCYQPDSKSGDCTFHPGQGGLLSDKKVISNEGAESLSRPAVAAELAGIQLEASLCRLTGRLLYGTKGFPHIPRHPVRPL